MSPQKLIKTNFWGKETSDGFFCNNGMARRAKRVGLGFVKELSTLHPYVCEQVNAVSLLVMLKLSLCTSSSWKYWEPFCGSMAVLLIATISTPIPIGFLHLNRILRQYRNPIGIG